MEKGLLREEGETSPGGALGSGVVERGPTPSEESSENQRQEWDGHRSLEILYLDGCDAGTNFRGRDRRVGNT